MSAPIRRLEGGNLKCGIAKQNKWERAMAYSASVQTFQEEYLAFLKKHGAHFDEKYLWHQLRPIIPYPTGRFFRGTLSQALRAWLRSACPSGTKPFAIEGPRIKLALVG